MLVQGVAVIGPGRVGGALAVALCNNGYSIDEVVYRSRRPSKKLLSRLTGDLHVLRFNKDLRLRSSLIFITVQDEELPRLVSELVGKVPRGATIFHTSGSISSEILEPFRNDRAKIASMHPLVSVPSWDVPASGFENIYFCIEGDQSALRTSKILVKALKARYFTIRTEQKGLYHASALMAAGHVTALFDIALGLLMKTGVKRPAARELLQPLIASVVTNLSVADTDQALTGTYARGDETTIQRHLDSLGSVATFDEIDVYLQLAGRSIDLAERNGLDSKKVKKMRSIIKMAKRQMQ